MPSSTHPKLNFIPRSRPRHVVTLAAHKRTGRKKGTYAATFQRLEFEKLRELMKRVRALRVLWGARRNRRCIYTFARGERKYTLTRARESRTHPHRNELRIYVYGDGAGASFYICSRRVSSTRFLPPSILITG